MKATDIIRLQAIGATLAQLDSSIQLGELEDSSISSAIFAFEKLAGQNTTINEIYTRERLDLKEQYQAKSKDKRYQPTSDSIYSVSAGNLSPSFPQSQGELEHSSEIAKDFDNLIASFNQIKGLYAVESPVETFQIIIEQEAIALLILEAHSKIRELFPTERLGLEVKTDPEIANWRSLWITIYTKLEVEEAFAKLKTLDRTWWLDASLVVPNNILNIDLGWE
ncbi:MAG: hypothetical protein QQW96_19285 [Tychonema bourrellyi B0820]|uniref:hypothetical protein n=1 Tax=Tychonema bourrellyi TaxID=54313 RepID=UPI001FE8B802|nr:hypothetical protein [Tychonema bourrellyi]MDQ2099780.1 hypothetical protein [Tychonema bourrellyi B0820]